MAKFLGGLINITDDDRNWEMAQKDVRKYLETPNGDSTVGM